MKLLDLFENDIVWPGAVEIIEKEKLEELYAHRLAKIDRDTLLTMFIESMAIFFPDEIWPQQMLDAGEGEMPTTLLLNWFVSNCKHRDMIEYLEPYTNMKVTALTSRLFRVHPISRLRNERI